jgi:hypothetical protein
MISIHSARYTALHELLQTPVLKVKSSLSNASVIVVTVRKALIMGYTWRSEHVIVVARIPHVGL